MANNRATSIPLIIGWIALALPEIGSGRVKLAERGGVGEPPPAFPYIAIEWASDRALSGTARERIDTTEVAGVFYKDVYSRRRATIRVSIYNKLSDDTGFDTLTELILSLNRQAVIDYLEDSDFALVRASDILDTTTLRRSKWEPACSIDFYLYYIRHDRSVMNVIESVDFTDES